MAHERDRLTALDVKRLAKQPGLHNDGGGLALRVTSATACSWVFRYMLDGKAREMGLGKFPDIGLARAREQAHKAREAKALGDDPIAKREAERQAKRLVAAKTMTFKQCADTYIKSQQAGWKNAKHAAQWPSTLQTYAYPVFGDLAVSAIDTGLVMKAVEPIWASKTETASRLRGRIESVLDWARTREYRTGENPARWKGHLDNLLPARAKVAKVEHHPALPWQQVGAFMTALRQQEGTAALALEFGVLTASRTGEVIGATWSEVDIGKAVWTVPAARMKAGVEHEVPLSPAALAIVKQLHETRTGDYVFAGGKAGRPLSNMALLMLVRRMNEVEEGGVIPWHDRNGEAIVPHGFRSTFRDWAADTGKARDITEAALAHTLGNKVEAAYRRTTMFDRRKDLMADWAAYCALPPGGATVVPMIRAANG